MENLGGGLPPLLAKLVHKSCLARNVSTMCRSGMTIPAALRAAAALAILSRSDGVPSPNQGRRVGAVKNIAATGGVHCLDRKRRLMTGRSVTGRAEPASRGTVRHHDRLPIGVQRLSIAAET